MENNIMTKDYLQELVDTEIIKKYSEETLKSINEFPENIKDYFKFAILRFDLNKDLVMIKHKLLDPIKKNKIDMRSKKELIELINIDLGISEVERKTFGEVSTPIYNHTGSVDEQLSLLDTDFWTNPDAKVLDPSCGCGNYEVVLLDKFMKGLKSWEPDAKKRYKHIMENIIYVVDINPMNLWKYYNIFDEGNKLKMNYYLGSFLEDDFDKHMKDVWKIDNFDLVCTNPPYNKSKKDGTNAGSIYDDFILKSIKYCDKLIFVIPLKWANNNSSKFRKNIINFGVEKVITFQDGDKIFGTTGIGKLCYLYLNKHNKKTEIINTHNNNIKDNDSFVIDLEKHKEIYINNFIYNDEIFRLISKINFSENLSMIYKNPQLIKTNLKTKSKHIIIGVGEEISIRKAKGEDKIINIKTTSDILNKLSYNKYKVCFEKIYGGYENNIYSNLDILEKNTITTEGLVYFDFDDINQATNFKNYISTKFVLFLKKIKQYDRSFTSIIFEYIPKLDFTRSWTDPELYEYFNLTQDEIDLIEKTIK